MPDASGLHPQRSVLSLRTAVTLWFILWVGILIGCAIGTVAASVYDYIKHRGCPVHTVMDEPE